MSNSILDSFISKSWKTINELKDFLDLLQTECPNSSKAETLINDLIDSYFICIGQLENLANKPTNNKDKVEPIKNNLEFASCVNADEIDLTIAEPTKLENKPKLDQSSNNLIIDTDDTWNCDFDEPVGQKLTDTDLYPETNN